MLKRIAMVGPYPLDGDRITGGIEAVAAYLVKGILARSRLELHVITVSDGEAAAPVIRRDGLTIHPVPSSGRWRRLTLYLRERWAIASRLRELRPDLVHVQGQNFYAAAALGAPYPRVVTLHGMLQKEAQILDRRSGWREQASKRLRGRFNSYFENFALRKASDLIVISPYVAECIAGRTSATLHNIENPIDDAFFKLPLAEVPGRLLFAGPLEPRKGLHHLLAAVGRLGDNAGIHLHIAGKTIDRSYAEEMHRYVRDHYLGSRVRFLGVVDQERLLREFAEASLIVMASREESSPMLIQQAMAAAKPVVAPKVGGIPHLVENGVTGLLVEPGNSEAMAVAIARLMEDDRSRQRMREEGRRRALVRFRAEAIAERTLEVYQSVLSRSKSAEQGTAHSLGQGVPHG